jgi:hypothetical protein
LNGRTQALAQRLVVLPHAYTQRGQIKGPGIHARCAEHEHSAGSVVGDSIDNANIPIRDARVDDLEARCDRLGCGENLSRRHAGAFQASRENQRDFRFCPRLNHPFGDTHGAAICDPHGIG